MRNTHGKVTLPVIVLTESSDSHEAVAALAQGANDYVSKNIDLPFLLVRIQRHVTISGEAHDTTTPQPIDLTGGIDAGTIVNDAYEIGEPLGEDGFAVVYRAIQLSTGQAVAFKCAKPERVRREGGTQMHWR